MRPKLFPALCAAIAVLSHLQLTDNAHAGTASLPAGQILTVNAATPDPGTNAVQRLQFTSQTTAGTFKLKYSSSTSALITFDDDPTVLATNIQTKLNLISSIGANGVACAGTSVTEGPQVDCTFSGGKVAKLAVSTLTVPLNSLVGDPHTITVSVQTAGVTADGRNAKAHAILITNTGDQYINNGIPGAPDFQLAVLPDSTPGPNSTITSLSGITGDIKTAPGNNMAIKATAPTPTVTPLPGKNASLIASNAVPGSGAGAAIGGDVTLTAGNAARTTSGNARGGDVWITPGAHIGTGVRDGHVRGLARIRAPLKFFPPAGGAQWFQNFAADGDGETPQQLTGPGGSIAMSWDFLGYQDNGTYGTGANWIVWPLENYTATNHGTGMEYKTAKVGANTPTTVIYLNDDGNNGVNIPERLKMDHDIVFSAGHLGPIIVDNNDVQWRIVVSTDGTLTAETP